MKGSPFIYVAAVLVLGVTASMKAQAGCENTLKVVGRQNAATIATYDAQGTKLGDVPKEQLAALYSLECNESLGLVKVKPTEGPEVWVKRGETKRVEQLVCNEAPVAKDPSHVVGATNGAEPACVPAKP